MTTSHEERLRRFEVDARALLEQLAEVRTAQAYCRDSERVKRAAPWNAQLSPMATDDTTTLDALERDILRRLAEKRTTFGIVVVH